MNNVSKKFKIRTVPALRIVPSARGIKSGENAIVLKNMNANSFRILSRKCVRSICVCSFALLFACDGETKESEQLNVMSKGCYFNIRRVDSSKVFSGDLYISYLGNSESGRLGGDRMMFVSKNSPNGSMYEVLPGELKKIAQRPPYNVGVTAKFDGDLAIGEIDCGYSDRFEKVFIVKKAIEITESKASKND